MTPNERPTPLTDESEQRMDDIPTKKALSYFVPADFARTLEQMLAERTEERDKLIEMRSYCMGILREAGHDEAAPIEALVRSSIAYASRMESDRDTALAKLATINHIAMSLFVRSTSSEVTGEMAEIGRLSREDGK